MQIKYLEDIPEGIVNKKTLKPYIEREYIIEDAMKSPDEYKKFEEHMYNLIKACFEIEECRRYPIKFLNFLTSTLCRTMVFLATIAMGGLVVLVEALVIALLAIV